MTQKEISSGTVHKLPEDLKKAIKSNIKVRVLWEDITPLARNEFICWVISAKQDETRSRRIRRTCEELLEGKRRPCCWSGCPHRQNFDTIRHMKKPFLHALGAALYIVGIVGLVWLFGHFLKDQPDTIIIPMTMLSLFVLSATVMGYLFLSEPIYLLLDNKKQEAIVFFGKTVGIFACFVVIFTIVLLLSKFFQISKNKWLKNIQIS